MLFSLIAGLVMSGIGVGKDIAAGNAAHAAGTAEEQAADQQANLDEYNAGVADAQAKDAEARGAIAVSRMNDQINGVIGAQRTAAAASNVDADFGSALDVQHDARTLGERDILTIQQNATREANGYEVQATNLRAEAGIARSTGKYQAAAANAQAGADYATAGQGILGAGLLAAKYGFRTPSAGPVGLDETGS